MWDLTMVIFYFSLIRDPRLMNWETEKFWYDSVIMWRWRKHRTMTDGQTHPGRDCRQQIRYWADVCTLAHGCVCVRRQWAPSAVEIRPWLPPTGPCLPAWCLPCQLGPLCYFHSCACTTNLVTIPHCFQHGKQMCHTTLKDPPVCIKPRQDLRQE